LRCVGDEDTLRFSSAAGVFAAITSRLLVNVLR
jgi:hypothetical protein